MTAPDRKTSLGQGALYLGASSLAFLLAGYVTNIWLGRRLGPVNYGRYGVVLTLISAVNVMQVSGIPQAMAKMVSERPREQGSFLRAGIRLQLMLTAVLVAVFLAAAVPLASLLNDPGLTGYLRSSVLILPLYGLFSVYVGYYNGLHRFGRQAGMVGGYAVAKTLLVIGLAATFGLRGAILGFAVAPGLGLIVGFRRPGRGPAAPLRELGSISVPLVGFAAMTTLQLSVDLLFVKAANLSPGAAGYYTAAQNIAVIPYFVMSAAGQVLFPTIASRLGAGDLTGARGALQRGFRYGLIAVVPAVAFLAVTRDEVVRLLFSERYIPAAGPLAILALGYGALGLFASLAYALNASGRGSRSFLLSAGGVVGMLVLCPILIPVAGLRGAAIGSAAPAVAVLLGGWWAVRFLGSRVPWATMGRVVLAAAVVSLPLLWMHPTPAALPFVYTAMALGYLLVLAATREVTGADLGMVKGMIGRPAG